jgi:hypothetical protein
MHKRTKTIPKISDKSESKIWLNTAWLYFKVKDYKDEDFLIFQFYGSILFAVALYALISCIYFDNLQDTVLKLTGILFLGFIFLCCSRVLLKN